MSWDELRKQIIDDENIAKGCKVLALGLLYEAEQAKTVIPDLADTYDKAMVSLVWGLTEDNTADTEHTLLGYDVWLDGEAVSFWHEWMDQNGDIDCWECNANTNTTKRNFLGRILETFGSRTFDA